jgi:hypothetical protein
MLWGVIIGAVVGGIYGLVIALRNNKNKKDDQQNNQ